MQHRFEEYAKLDLAGIESELKNWFIQRRFAMERNATIKKTLDDNGFSGLSMNNPDVTPELRTLWGDLVTGKPSIDESLSSNAKVMKAEMYLTTFQNSTDLDHPCRESGVSYLRCLNDFALEEPTKRSTRCDRFFPAFQACRQKMLQQQQDGFRQAMIRQDTADRRAKALFDRRNVLLAV